MVRLCLRAGGDDKRTTLSDPLLKWGGESTF
jgi:hypothetical protein